MAAQNLNDYGSDEILGTDSLENVSLIAGKQPPDSERKGTEARENPGRKIRSDFLC